MFEELVKVDETYFGGHRKNESNTKRKELTKQEVDMTAFVGAKERKTNKIAAKLMRSTDKVTLQGLLAEHAVDGATVYAEDARAYKVMPFNQETETRSPSEYVKGTCEPTDRVPVVHDEAGAEGHSTSCCTGTLTAVFRSLTPVTTCARVTPSTS